MAPPSSGGICFMQIFKMIEPYDLSGWGTIQRQPFSLLSKQKEGPMQIAPILGDPDFVKIPLKALMDETT
jgi:gamma-glutamyltranspeptidase/glutathione hydrolase